jgi:hypothetical protein
MKMMLARYVMILVVVVGTILTATAANLTIPAAGRVTVELVSSDADFSNTLAVFTPNVATSISGCKLEPATGLTGVPVLSEKISQRGCRVDLDFDPATAGIQGFPANTTFEFRFCAQIDADDDCEFVWSSNPANNVPVDAFDHLKTTPLFATDFPGQIFQLAWEDEQGGGDQDFNDLIAVIRVQSDTDGDGLWDDWEMFGIDTNGDGSIDLDLPSLGADVMRKDLFLELDYMDCAVAGGDCVAASAHNHQPKAAAVQAVIDAFANASTVMNPDGSTGIDLHIDVDDAIVHQNFLEMPLSGVMVPAGVADFNVVKADPANFGTTNPRRFAYRYGIVVHRRGPNTSSSGRAEIQNIAGVGFVGGNDFIMSLGEWFTTCISAGMNGVLDTIPVGDDLRIGTQSLIRSGPNLVCDTAAAADDTQVVPVTNAPPADVDGDMLDDRNVGNVQVQAGTLMHEFGHTLALLHGGDQPGTAFNYKPNYLSIMNYTFQNRGIGPDPDMGGPFTRSIDYSVQGLPNLDELNDMMMRFGLNEPAGIGGGVAQTLFSCPAGGLAFGAAMGAINWNCDMDNTDIGITADINGVGGNTMLNGFDDWANIRYAFQDTPDFEDGARAIPEDQEEMDESIHLTIPEGVRIDIQPFDNGDLNVINTKRRGVIPVAICNGGAVRLGVDISDSSSPNGFSNASTNLQLHTVQFALDMAREPLGNDAATVAHDLTDPILLGKHLTEYIDTNFDSLPDTLVPIDAGNCAGDPAGPDLVLHFSSRNTGISKEDVEACIAGKLIDGSSIVGCDAVRVKK